ncbi:MAG: glycosyltransferase [Candidatus Bathyarchaeia archaeon]
MRIYIAPSGIGLGHIARSTPIIEELVARGHEVVVSTYLDGLKYARAKGLRVVEAVPISFRVRSDGTVDFKQTAARSGLSLGLRRFLKQVVVEIRNIKSTRPNIIISDSRGSTLVAAKLLRIPAMLIINQFRIEIVRRPSSGGLSLLDRVFFIFANIFWILVRTLIMGLWGQSRIIIIPDFACPYTISQNNLAIPRRYRNKVTFVGPIIQNVPQGLPGRESIIRRLGLPNGKAMIYASVSGPTVERMWLSERLLKILPKIGGDYSFVTSCGEPGEESSPVRVGNMLIYRWLRDEEQLMILKASDLVISRSGHGMVTKALTYGKPLILIPTPDHTEQYGNARRATELGVALMIEQKDLSVEELSKCIVEILNSPKYREKAQHISKVASSLNSVKTVVDIVERMADMKPH